MNTSLGERDTLCLLFWTPRDGLSHQGSHGPPPALLSARGRKQYLALDEEALGKSFHLSQAPVKNDLSNLGLRRPSQHPHRRRPGGRVRHTGGYGQLHPSKSASCPCLFFLQKNGTSFSHSTRFNFFFRRYNKKQGKIGTEGGVGWASLRHRLGRGTAHTCPHPHEQA